MFGYGFLAVVLVLYLAAAGLDPLAIGIVLTLTLIGDTIISLWLTTNADRLRPAPRPRRRRGPDDRGRRSSSRSRAGVPLLILAGAIGVISPTGNEVGPFLAIEQAALTQTIPDRRRTATFAWYNLVGYVATATGALGAGLLSQALSTAAVAPLDAYRAIVIGYALHRPRRWSIGFWRLGPAHRGAAARRSRPTASGAGSGSGARRASSSSCRSCSRSTPSAAASSRRA